MDADELALKNVYKEVSTGLGYTGTISGSSQKPQIATGHWQFPTS